MTEKGFAAAAAGLEAGGPAQCEEAAEALGTETWMTYRTESNRGAPL